MAKRPPELPFKLVERSYYESLQECAPAMNNVMLGQQVEHECKWNGAHHEVTREIFFNRATTIVTPDVTKLR